MILWGAKKLTQARHTLRQSRPPYFSSEKQINTYKRNSDLVLASFLLIFDISDIYEFMLRTRDVAKLSGEMTSLFDGQLTTHLAGV